MNTRYPAPRALLPALTCMLLLGATTPTPGMSPEVAGTAIAPVAAEPTTEDRDQPPAAVTVTLVITGKGKPVEQAEVRISFPADSGGETTLRTNERGEAVFKTAFKGTARMRVIAAGWESLMKDVAFKGAAQRLPISLNAFE
jgi:hypothetical protein